MKRDVLYVTGAACIAFTIFVAALLIGGFFLHLAVFMVQQALAFKQNLVKAVMSEGGGLLLPEPIWTKLCIAWGVFFIFKGTLNIWVAYAFDTDTWVNFKLFGGMGLMFAFVIAQAMWLSKYLPEDPPKGAAPAKGEGK